MNENLLNLVFCIVGIGLIIAARLICIVVKVRKEPIDDNAGIGDNKKL